ncbi:hypothetical protein SAZ11_53515 [Streptomyces sp. FXJ1.4098]|nr:hypothetical protein [Streptomyces sp. FXJ1.4098]
MARGAPAAPGPAQRPHRPAWRSGPLAAELARCAAVVDDTVRSAAPRRPRPGAG